MIREYRRKTPRILKIHLEESEPLERLELGQAGFFEADIIVGIQVVGSQYLVTTLQEPPGYVIADESGRTCNQDDPACIAHLIGQAGSR